MDCKYEIIPVCEHFEVHIDGEFYCSADTFSEAKQDIDDYIDSQREINYTNKGNE